ncbi:MAG: hypothetical protein MMC33_004155 [Icmadophila ericetorum]|nr:hypothetical protein [Icmadophila ericetorum]
MSRRPNPAADRAAQNQQTIKTLLKLEGNKGCADCKRNKHPRWASWNLGVFVCIRCSGIHRGMGTHISRVKSVDLDSWTDEQLQSILRWGNSRANKYWEAKLAPGHVPSEAKIENFIRTKYESKRWTMDGPMPDPSTLDADGDDDVPLNIVKEQAKLDRTSSQRSAPSSSRPAPPIQPPPRQTPQTLDLFGDDEPTPPVRPSTTDNTSTRPPPPKLVEQPSQLLGGLDFFGGPPERPASASSKPTGSTGPSRPDLKQSILSLYSQPSRTQSQPPQQPPQHGRQPSFDGMQPSSPQQSSAFGGLDDAFKGLTFSSSTSGLAPKHQQQQPQLSSFASFGQTSSQRAGPAPPQVTAPLSGGGFFEMSSKPPTKQTAIGKTTNQPAALRKISNASDGFGDFSSAMNPMTASSVANSSNGLLDLSSPQPTTISSARPANPSNVSSVFNLSAPKPSSNYQPVIQSSAPPTKTEFAGFTSSNAWATSDPWAAMEPSTPSATPVSTAKSPTASSALASDFGWGTSGTATSTKSPALFSAATDFGWGNPQSAGLSSSGSGGFGMTSVSPPKIAAEEDFGGWNSAAPETPAIFNPPVFQSSSSAFQSKPPAPAKPTPNLNPSEDLWSNVWQ